MKKVALIGLPYFTEQIAKVISGEDFSFKILSHETWKKMSFPQKKYFLSDVQVVHFIWGQRKVNVFLWAKWRGLIMINHYVGTDVLRLLEGKKSNWIKAKISNLLASKTLSISPNLQSELKSLGIPSEVSSFHVLELPDNLPPLPEFPAAFAYIPAEREDFYGWHYVEQLIRDFPQVTFYILGHKGEGKEKFENAQFLGWQADITPWIRASHIYIRMTKHDGLPRTILEALSYGRQVIFNREFPHCRYAGDYRQLKEQFADLLAHPELNVEGAQFVREKFHPDAIKKQLIDLYHL